MTRRGTGNLGTGNLPRGIFDAAEAANAPSEVSIPITTNKLVTIIVSIIISLAGTGVWANFKSQEIVTKEDVKEIKRLIEESRGDRSREHDAIIQRLDRNYKELIDFPPGERRRR